MDENKVMLKSENDDYVFVSEQTTPVPNENKKGSLEVNEPVKLNVSEDRVSLTPKPDAIAVEMMFYDKMARLRVLLSTLATFSYTDEPKETLDPLLGDESVGNEIAAAKDSISVLFKTIPEKYESLVSDFMSHIIRINGSNYGLSEICSGFNMLSNQNESKIAKSLAKRLYGIFFDFLELDFRILVKLANTKTNQSDFASSDKQRATALNMLLVAEKKYRIISTKCKEKEAHSLDLEKQLGYTRRALDHHDHQLHKKLRDIENAKAKLVKLNSTIEAVREELGRLEGSTKSSLGSQNHHPPLFGMRSDSLSQDTSSDQHRTPPNFPAPIIGIDFDFSRNTPSDKYLFKKTNSMKCEELASTTTEKSSEQESTRQQQLIRKQERLLEELQSMASKSSNKQRDDPVQLDTFWGHTKREGTSNQDNVSTLNNLPNKVAVVNQGTASVQASASKQDGTSKQDCTPKQDGTLKQDGTPKQDSSSILDTKPKQDTASKQESSTKQEGLSKDLPKPHSSLPLRSIFPFRPLTDSEPSGAYGVISSKMKKLATDPRVDTKFQSMYRHIGDQCNLLQEQLNDKLKKHTFSGELYDPIDQSTLFDLHCMIFRANKMLDMRD